MDQVGLEADVGAVLQVGEHLGDLGMLDRVAGVVADQVLLRDVGDVVGVRALGQQVVEGLVLARPDVLRDRLVPLLGVAELGSTSKITPRNGKIRCLTTWPMPNFAVRSVIVAVLGTPLM